MPNVRTSPMDSQRYDCSTRRKLACLPTNTAFFTLSANEGAVQPSKYTEHPWEDRWLITPSGRTTPSDSTFESGSIIGPSNVSLVESCTSTLSGLPLPSKNQSANRLQPSLRKSRSSISRVLCGLDCRRSNASVLSDDLDYIPPRLREKKLSTSEKTVAPFPLKKDKEIRFTNVYNHEDGYTTTRTIIRPRGRTRSTPQGNAMSRMRSLDCMRSSTAFEDDLDAVLQTHSLQPNAQQCVRLRIDEECTVVAEEKWRSAVQSILYQKALPVRSVVSRVEVD